MRRKFSTQTLRLCLLYLLISIAITKQPFDSTRMMLSIMNSDSSVIFKCPISSVKLPRNLQVCDPSCLTCSGSGPMDCLSCDAGRYQQGTSCPLCTAPCNTCSITATLCDSCPLSGYFLNGTVCDLCNPTCNACTGPSPTNCSSCPNGAYLDTGSCLSCNAPCVNCTGPTESQCLSCIPPNYFASGYCCFPGCSACSGSLSTQCSACSNNFYLDGASCLECHSTCLTCTGPMITDCILCEIGLFLDTGTCIPCDPTCVTCSGPFDDQCLSCGAGQSLSGGYCCHSSCTTCSGILSSQCLTCAAQRYFSSGSCSSCESSCSSCSGPLATDCTVCYPGLSLRAGRCCHGSCLTCDGLSNTSCLTCLGSAVLIAGECISCDSSCNGCTGITNMDCTQCKNRFYLNGLACEPCDPTCLKCSGPLSNQCTHCSFGNYLILGECISCHGTCALCNGQLSTDCTSCYVGSYLSSGSCLTCDPTCRTCSGPAQTDCTDCSTDKYLDGLGKCIPCDLTCLTCSNGTPLGCSTCNSGWSFIVTGECVLCDLSCLSCLGNLPTQCLTCPAQKYRDGSPSGPCLSCSPTCYECSGPSASECTSCPTGYYLNIGQCLPCHATCHNCSGPAISQCTSCSSGSLRLGYCCNSSCQACSGPLASECTACASNKYLAGSPTGTCNNCHATCVTCNGPLLSNCLSCNKTILKSGACCNPTCQTCSGYLIKNCTSCALPAILGSGYCCHNTCKTCLGSAINQCDTCEVGFKKVNGHCCDLTCGTCNGALRTNCISCIAPLELRSNSCCHSSCLTCSGPLISQCLSCSALRTLSQGFCCDGSCQTCTGSLDNQCSTCLIGKTHFSGFCCSGGCLTCTSSSSTDCTSCAPGFYSVGSTCHACHPNCATCSGSPLDCMTCTQGRPTVVLVVTPTCCYSGCLTCTGTEFNQCLTCLPNWTLLNGECLFCHETCLTCTGPASTECTSCPVGIYHKPETAMTISCTPCTDWSRYSEGILCLEKLRFQVVQRPELKIAADTHVYELALMNSILNDADKTTVYDQVSKIYGIQIDFRDLETGSIESTIRTKYSMKSLSGMILLYVTILSTPQKHDYNIEISSPSDTNIPGFTRNYRAMIGRDSLPYTNMESLSNPSTTTVASTLQLLSEVQNPSNEAAFAGVLFILALDPTGTFLRFTQGMKFFGYLYYININYGKRLDTFLSKIGDMPKHEGNLSSYRHLPGFRGKWSKKRVQVEFPDKTTFVRVIVYFAVWIINILHQIFIRFTTVPKYYLPVLYYFEKLKIMVFMLFFPDLALRTKLCLLHGEGYSTLSLTITWAVVFLLTIDTISVALFIFDDKVWAKYYKKAKILNTEFSEENIIGPTQAPTTRISPEPESQSSEDKNRPIHYKNTYEEISTNYHLMEILGAKLRPDQTVFNSKLCRSFFLIHLGRLMVYMAVISSGQYISGLSVGSLLAFEVVKTAYALITHFKYKLFRLRIFFIMETGQSFSMIAFLTLAFLLHFKRFNELVGDSYQDAGIWIIIASCGSEYILLLIYIGIAAYDFFKNRKRRNKRGEENKELLNWRKYAEPVVEIYRLPSARLKELPKPGLRSKTPVGKLKNWANFPKKGPSTRSIKLQRRIARTGEDFLYDVPEKNIRLENNRSPDLNTQNKSGGNKLRIGGPRGDFKRMLGSESKCSISNMIPPTLPTPEVRLRSGLKKTTDKARLESQKEIQVYLEAMRQGEVSDKQIDVESLVSSKRKIRFNLEE